MSKSKSYTDITILLDDSGSMNSTKDVTLAGLRNFIAEQQAQPGEAVLSLVKFHDRGHIKRELEIYPLRAIKTEDLTFDPHGPHTALRDAWLTIMAERGRMFRDLRPSMRPDKVLFVVITDGYDNASFASREQLREAVTHQRDVYSWQFAYLGANHEAEEEAVRYGVPLDFAMKYDPTSVASATGSLSASVASYRSEGVLRSFTAEDRTKAVGK